MTESKVVPMWQVLLFLLGLLAVTCALIILVVR